MVRNVVRNPPPNVASAGKAAWRFSVLVAITAMMVAAVASAQAFKSETVDPLLRTKSRIVQQIAKDPARYAAEKEFVTQFFQNYFFPKMTQASPEELGDLGDLRLDFFSRYVRPASGAMQSDLTDMAFAFVRKVIPDANYHPAVRYNAVLMLGLLDSQYATDSGGSPQPKPEATQLLLQIAKLAGKNPRVTPGLLVGVLVGLERHAQLAGSLPAPLVAEMRKTLLEVAAREEPFGEEEPDVHQWIRRKAAIALTRLPGAEGLLQTAQALLMLIGDQDISLDERCEAAALLDRLQLAESGIDGTTICRSLVLLANDVAVYEAEQAQEFEDSQVNPRLGRRRSRNRFDNTPDRYERSRLLARLEKLERGLQAVEPVVADDAKSRVQATLSAIAAVKTLGYDDKELDLDFALEIKRMARAIEAAASGWEVAGPAAATADAQSEVAVGDTVN